MTAPMTPDEARLREAIERIEADLADLSGMLEVMGDKSDPLSWSTDTKVSDLRMVLDALSAERERGDRAVGLLNRWMMADHPIITTQVKRDTRAFLATQKAEGA